jgi:hypothetical protein
MIKLNQIISQATKIMGRDRRTSRVEALIMAAYEAGRADAIKDIVITLEDDMINSDHIDAIELINANAC